MDDMRRDDHHSIVGAHFFNPIPLSLSSSLFPARGKAYVVYIPPTSSLNDDSCLRFYFYLFIYSHQKDATVIERKRCISTSGRNGCTSYYFVMQKRPSIYIIWERRKIIFREKLPRWTKRRRSDDRRIVFKKTQKKARGKGWKKRSK